MTTVIFSLRQYACFIILLMMAAVQNLYGQHSLAKDSVQTDTSGAFITFRSPYLIISCAKDFPMIAYLGVESAGRSHRILDRSMLRPGIGGTVVSADQNSFGAKSKASLNNQKINYRSIPFRGNQNRDCEIESINNRSFSLEVGGKSPLFQGEFFKIATAPDIAPVTIWAERASEIVVNNIEENHSAFEVPVKKFSWKLPAILHFPDYGLVKVESADSSIFIEEQFVPDYANAGLALGPFNRGPHSEYRSYHLGTIILSFQTKKTVNKAKIIFTVLEENYPKISNCDFSDAKFDGLKRCWQNSFPVNPEQHCMGDNLLLNGIAQFSMLFKADMNVFTPKLPGNESVSDALGRTLELTFAQHVNQKTGRIDDYGWETTESCLISLYDYLLATNDWPLVYRNLSNIRKAVASVMATDKDGDGIMESPFNGNHFEDSRASLNWWDDFAFGNKDAYVNLLAYRALLNMETMFSKMDLAEDVKPIALFNERFRKVFHQTFFNPITGVYGGWISKDGKMHDYMFSFINAMAINLDLVEPKLAKDILNKLLGRMEKEGYDFVFGVPGPTMPVAKEDRQGWEEMSRWGRYENGGLCGQTAYHFIQALYSAGMREKADEILFKMMATFEREYTHSGLFPGYFRSVDWRTKGGEPCGYNYLADNYYFLLAAVTGYYGIKFPALKKPENRLVIEK